MEILVNTLTLQRLKIDCNSFVILSLLYDSKKINFLKEEHIERYLNRLCADEWITRKGASWKLTDKSNDIFKAIRTKQLGLDDIDSKYKEFIDIFNGIMGVKREYGDKKAKKQLAVLLKNGYTLDDMSKAIQAAKADAYHTKVKYKYLTPEFITRDAKFPRFYNEYKENENENKVSTTVVDNNIFLNE